MDDRAKRIVETAVELAERDGYQAVRLREVAAAAQVALGTVYKRFAGKEEILIAALELESEKLIANIGRSPVPGDSAVERIRFVFGALTEGFVRRPNLARALIRSLASGDPSLAERVAGFHDVITALVMAAIRGEAPPNVSCGAVEQDGHVRAVASIVQNVWFASLVGWCGGLHDAQRVLAETEQAARLLLRR